MSVNLPQFNIAQIERVSIDARHKSRLSRFVDNKAQVILAGTVLEVERSEDHTQYRLLAEAADGRVLTIKKVIFDTNGDLVGIRLRGADPLGVGVDITVDAYNGGRR